MSKEKPQFSPEEAWRKKEIDEGVIPEEQRERLYSMQDALEKGEVAAEDLWNPDNLAHELKEDPQLVDKLMYGFWALAGEYNILGEEKLARAFADYNRTFTSEKVREGDISERELSEKIYVILDALEKGGIKKEKLNLINIIKEAYFHLARTAQIAGELNPWEYDLFDSAKNKKEAEKQAQIKEAPPEEHLSDMDVEGKKKALEGEELLKKLFPKEKGPVKIDKEERLNFRERVKAIEGRAYLERLVYGKEGIKDKKLKEVADKMERLPEDIQRDEEWRRKQREEIQKRSD